MKSHLYLFILGAVITAFAFLLSGIVLLSTINWKEANVVVTVNTGEQCENGAGRGTIPFNYKTNGTGPGYMKNFIYEVNGKRYTLTACTASAGVQTVWYNPSNPAESKPERTQTYLLYVLMAITGIIIMLFAYYDANKHDERPLI